MQLRALLLLFLFAISVSGCDAIGAIFEAGFWTAIALVVLIVALAGFVFAKFRR